MRDYSKGVDNPEQKIFDERKGWNVCPFAYGVKPLAPCQDSKDTNNFSSNCSCDYESHQCFKEMIRDMLNPQRRKNPSKISSLEIIETDDELIIEAKDGMFPSNFFGGGEPGLA